MRWLKEKDRKEKDMEKDLERARAKEKAKVDTRPMIAKGEKKSRGQ